MSPEIPQQTPTYISMVITVPFGHPWLQGRLGNISGFFFFSKLSSLKKSFLQQECYWSGTHPHTAMTSLGSTSDGKIFVGESCLEHVKVDMAVTPMS